MRFTERVAIQWVILLFCFLCRCSAHTAESNSEGHSVNGRRARWERLDGPVSSSAATAKGASIREMAAGRRACGLYIWDAPSALLHKWCSHLLRDCIYEGRGGHKFVRIEPASIAQLLYPLSRHSPDRCLLCKGNFQDHLTLWWSKHLYSAYDNILERTYAEGVTFSNPQEEQSVKYYGGRKAPPRYNPPKPKPRYAYHRRYVTDIESTNVGSKKSQPKIPTDSLLEKRVALESNVAYSVPALGKSKDGSRPSETLGFVREILLQQVDNLIDLEDRDNAVGETY